ncbi:MAG: response regulator [Holophaga sp.]|nr:response regulator [Holophaga sp.]
MANKVLLVDDEENVLHGFHRVLHKRFELEVAMGGPQALLAMEHHGPFAVIVSDMKMPGMTGLDLLQEARARAPEATRIMLTGNLDQQTAMDAVNHGQVFRFLTKPCSPGHLAEVIQAGLRQHQLVIAEKELLEQTLMGSLQVLMDLLSNLDPQWFGRGRLLRDRAVAVARALRLEPEWDLETAALLLPIGRIALPPEFLARLKSGAALDVREQALLDRVPETGARLIASIPRLHRVSQYILYQAKAYDGSGYPAGDPGGEEIPMGARILKVVNDFTSLELKLRSRAVALEELALHREAYDGRVLAALYAQFGAPASATEVSCPVEGLREGMVLSRHVLTRSGRPVLLAGLKLGAAHLVLLRDVVALLDLQEPVYVSHE